MKRHSTDLVSLTFALIFAFIAGWWLIGRFVMDVNLNVPNLGLFIAGGLILLGLLGVFGSLRRDRRGNEPVAATPTAPAPDRTPPFPSEPTLGDPDTMPTIITNPYLTPRQPDANAVDTPGWTVTDRPDEPDTDERDDFVAGDTEVRATEEPDGEPDGQARAEQASAETADDRLGWGSPRDADAIGIPPWTDSERTVEAQPRSEAGQMGEAGQAGQGGQGGQGDPGAIAEHGEPNPGGPTSGGPTSGGPTSTGSAMTDDEPPARS
jgi:hypothetical protein